MSGGFPRFSAMSAGVHHHLTVTNSIYLKDMVGSMATEYVSAAGGIVAPSSREEHILEHVYIGVDMVRAEEHPYSPTGSVTMVSRIDDGKSLQSDLPAPHFLAQ